VNFQRSGKHEVTLLSIRDGNRCEQQVETSAQSSVRWEDDSSSKQITKRPAAVIEVAEIAAIRPVSTQTDYCIGDSLDFILEGIAPWTITYSWQNQTKDVVSRSSRFSRIAEKSGTFAITSVKHQHEKCNYPVYNLVKQIHQLPRVRLASGDSKSEAIREGDSAEMVFQFEGTPPFSFTYVRMSENTGEILEDKSVTDITDSSYTVRASEAGTWAVTYIKDRYCSFPRTLEAQPK